MAAATQGKNAWVANMYGHGGPFKFPGKFQAGATQAIFKGELIKLSGGNWVPLDTDTAMTAIVAIADCDIRSGDLAGYYPIIVPRPGDVFEFALAASTTTTVGQSLYVAGSATTPSQTLTVTAGTNIIGNVVDSSVIPMQAHASVSPGYDAGTTLLARSQIHCTIKAAASYYAALQT